MGNLLIMKRDLAHTLTSSEVSGNNKKEAQSLLNNIKNKQQKTKIVLVKSNPPTWKEIKINEDENK